MRSKIWQQTKLATNHRMTKGKTSRFLGQYIVQHVDLDEQVGANAYDKLAFVVNHSFTKTLNKEKIKPVMDTYHRAQNRDILVSLKVDPEIWGKIKLATKSRDVKIQKSKTNRVKAAVAKLAAWMTCCSQPYWRAPLPMMYESKQPWVLSHWSGLFTSAWMGGR